MVIKSAPKPPEVIALENCVQEVYQSFSYYYYGPNPSAYDIIINLIKSTQIYPPAETLMQDLYLMGIEEYGFQAVERLFLATGIRPTRRTIQRGRRDLHLASRLEEFKKLGELADEIEVDFRSHYAFDTNVLVDLMLSPQGQDHFKNQYQSFPDCHVHTHKLCIGEAKGVLIHDYGFTEEEANSKIDTTLKNSPIGIFSGKSTTPDIDRVREIGKKYGIKEKDKDIYIIHQFFKWQVTIVSHDNHFLDTCKDLGRDIIRWPDFYDRQPEKISRRRERW